MIVIAAVVLAIAALPAVLFLWNLVYYRPARRSGSDRVSVSVLIPARDEERSIESSVRAALASRDIDLEVIVADDHSHDRTAEVVELMAKKDQRVRLISVPPLPHGWCGKQFACHVLAHAAHHETLCFLDADVQLAPDGLASLVDTLRANDADLLSGFPEQETVTFLEQLLIPLMHFVLLGFLPMIGVKKTRDPIYSAGCGQLFIADASAYRKAGGHAAIQNSRHDGIALPRVFRQAGFMTDLCDATRAARCRMYCNGPEVVRGLLKNATEGLATPARIVPFSLLLVIGQVCPFALLAFVLFHRTSDAALALAAGACLLSYLPRFVAARKFGQPFLGVAFHPLAILILLAIQWYAFFLAAAGVPSVWKRRTYSAS